MTFINSVGFFRNVKTKKIYVWLLYAVVKLYKLVVRFPLYILNLKITNNFKTQVKIALFIKVAIIISILIQL